MKTKTSRLRLSLAALPRFPDFGYMMPPGTYNGRVFVLSQDFPRTLPKSDAGVKKILGIDFKQDWRAYLMAVPEYVFEGNIEPADYENDFFWEDNKVRKWFHVPWQHWGSTGREGFHGLTQEGPVSAKMLALQQTQTTHAYAVGFYNDLGGYTIGFSANTRQRSASSARRSSASRPMPRTCSRKPSEKRPPRWCSCRTPRMPPSAITAAGATRRCTARSFSMAKAGCSGRRSASPHFMAIDNVVAEVPRLRALTEKFTRR